MAGHTASPEEPVCQDGRPDFEIGLALAGAISAGAYTAGVIDFLVQALQEWEKARSGPVPTHRVRVRTIAGASAGAITGALGIVALRHGLRPEALSAAEEVAAEATPGADKQRIRCVLPTLHRTWVERPRMVAAAGSHELDLLGTEDLDGGKRPVRSLLNARLLDEIQAAALKGPGPLPKPDPKRAYLDPSPGPFPFLAGTMHVYLTVTNLRGIPFEIGFGAASYGMLTHGDRLHYRIAQVGAPIPGPAWAETNFLGNDTFIPLDAGSLPEETGLAPPCAWMSYGTSAVASAAFPGGLAPRLIETPFGQYTGRQYPLPVASGSVTARFPTFCDLDGSFRFLSIDGGVVNNTPFDFVEYALWNGDEVRRTGSGADRAVIMVAPFPEPPTFLGEGMPTDEFGSVVKALLPTLMNQARFRSSELGRALQPDDKSRFLISPRRSLKEGPPERYPIACGLLGGFGGFLDEAFRAHDFQLGRRNCQSFLASVFGLPPAPASGQQEEPSAFQTGEAARQAPVSPRPDAYNAAGRECMIIPLLGEAHREVGLPPWPRMSGQDFRTLVARIDKRYDAIKDPLIEAQVRKREIRGIAKLLARVSRSRLTNLIALAILADLVRRDQIAGWDLPPAVSAKMGDLMRRHPDTYDGLILENLPSTALEAAQKKLESLMTEALRAILPNVPPDVRGTVQRMLDAQRDNDARRVVECLPSGVRQAIEAQRAGHVCEIVAALPSKARAWAERAIERRWLDDGRLVLGVLVGAGADGAPVTDICAATHLRSDVVEAILAGLQTLPKHGPNCVLYNGAAYVLAMHVPVGLRALPFIGGWIERFAPQPYRYA